jgi:hypothetical protein
MDLPSMFNVPSKLPSYDQAPCANYDYSTAQQIGNMATDVRLTVHKARAGNKYARNTRRDILAAVAICTGKAQGVDRRLVLTESNIADSHCLMMDMMRKDFLEAFKKASPCISTNRTYIIDEISRLDASINAYLESHGNYHQGRRDKAQ